MSAGDVEVLAAEVEQLKAELTAALAELAQVTQWHDEVRQECAELRGGVGAIKAEALREAAADLHDSTEATDEDLLTAKWLRDRADALSGTANDIGDGTNEGDQG